MIFWLFLKLHSGNMFFFWKQLGCFWVAWSFLGFLLYYLGYLVFWRGHVKSENYDILFWAMMSHGFDHDIYIYSQTSELNELGLIFHSGNFEKWLKYNFWSSFSLPNKKYVLYQHMNTFCQITPENGALLEQLKKTQRTYWGSTQNKLGTNQVYSKKQHRNVVCTKKQITWPCNSAT